MDLHPGERKHPFPVDVPVAWGPIRRDLEASKEENEDWYRDLVQHSQDLLCVHDLEGRFLSVNPVPARLLGYTVEELLQKPMQDFIPQHFLPRFEEYLREIAQTGESNGMMVVLTRSGEQRIWEYHNTLRTNGVSVPIVRGIAHDVTDRIRAEKALRDTNEQLLKTAQEREKLIHELTLFRALLDQSNDAIEVTDPKTLRFLDVNQRACIELGYSREELLSMTISEVDPDVTGESIAQVAQQMRDTGSVTMERTHRRKNGTTFPVEANLSKVQLDREYGVAVVRNITDRNETLDRLREFERVVENLEEMIAVVNRDYRYVLVNRAFLSYRGLTKEDVVGRLISEVLDPELFKDILKDKLDESFGGRVVTFDLQHFYPAMGTLQRELSITYLPVEGPTEIDRVACVLRDVTERKQTEQALRHSEARERARADELETVLDVVPIPVLIAHDVNCLRITANRSGNELLRAQAGRNVSKTGPPGGQPSYRIFHDGVEVSPNLLPIQLTASTGRPLSGHALTMVFEDGTTRETSVNTVPLFDVDGKVRGAIGASIDLTEIREAERALRESELQFRAVYERSPIGIALVDSFTGKFLQVNPKYCEITGRGEEELLRTDIVSITHPDDISSGNEYLRQMTEAKLANFEMEKRYLRPDGSVRWVRLLVVPMSLPQESLRWHMALVDDITDRKRTADDLCQSEERFRVALKNSPTAVFHLDRDLRYTWMHNTQLPGPLDQYLGKTPIEAFNLDEGRAILKIRQQVLQTGVGVRHESIVTREGKRHYYDSTIEPVFDSTGTVIGLTGASTDVTPLREANEALREAKKRLTEEKLYLEQEIDTELGFGEIVGQSKALRRLMAQVGKVASSSATALLLGETGTGKELVARAIHRLSPRAKNSFIKLNCAAIPLGLLESELFGHERGAFTGAVTRKIGRLELADKGTLFLDEIGEISLALQPKLLRVLQDQEFERLGGTQTIKVDFRLIAATNRDLAEQVREFAFRSDLYYRLNVFPIRVPPLRDRREDIPLLVEHFVQKCARRMNKSITSVPTRIIDALMKWDWPGNVRELENFIERSVILSQGSVLVSPLAELESVAAVEPITDDTLEATEREHILRALRETRGQIGGLRGAAVRLGLKRTTLQSKIKHLGIDPRSAHQ
jgi:PAS domain S-box-containing protein